MAVTLPLLPVGVSRGFLATPVWDTTIHASTSRRERRIRNLTRPFHRYAAQYGLRDDAAIQAVRTLVYTRRGRGYDFLIRDWSDWKSCNPGEMVSATDQLIGIGDGSKKQFQLVKTYDDGVSSFTRAIRRPAPGTVVCALDGVATTAFTVDTTTGLLNFTSAPSAGVEVTSGFEHFVRVRFDDDFVDAGVEISGQVSFIPPFGMVEVKDE